MQNSLKDKILKKKQQDTPQEPQEQMKLDDARRVKVLSPGMLVFKRFIRNKLAVTGIIILAFMFVFSFIGPLFSPYKIAQTFFKGVTEDGKYASGKINEDSRLWNEKGENKDENIRVALLKVLGDFKDKATNEYQLTAGQEIEFTTIDGTKMYIMRVVNPDPKKPSIEIFEREKVAALKSEEIAKAEMFGKNVNVKYNVDTLSDELKALIEENAATKMNRPTEIEFEDLSITVVALNKNDIRYYAMSDVQFEESSLLNDELKAMIIEHADNGSDETAPIVYEGISVSVERTGEGGENEIAYYVLPSEPIAVMTFYIYTAMRGRIGKLQSDPTFWDGAQAAIRYGETSFRDGSDTEYRLTQTGSDTYDLCDAAGTKLFSVLKQTENARERLSYETGDKELVDRIFALIAENEEKLRSIREEAHAAGKPETEIFNAMTAAAAVPFTYTNGRGTTDYVLYAIHDDASFSGNYALFQIPGNKQFGPIAELRFSVEASDAQYNGLCRDPQFIHAVRDAIIGRWTDTPPTFRNAGKEYLLSWNRGQYFDYWISDASGNSVADAHLEPLPLDDENLIYDMRTFSTILRTINDGVSSFEMYNDHYTVTADSSGTVYTVSRTGIDAAYVTEIRIGEGSYSFIPIETDYDKLNSDYRFIIAAEKAIAAKAETFGYDGETYTLEKYPEHDAYTVYCASGEPAVLISEIACGPFGNGTELTIDFVLKFQEAVWESSENDADKEFCFVNQYGEEKSARLHTMNENDEVWMPFSSYGLIVRTPDEGTAARP